MNFVMHKIWHRGLRATYYGMTQIWRTGPFFSCFQGVVNNVVSKPMMVVVFFFCQVSACYLNYVQPIAHVWIQRVDSAPKHKSLQNLVFVRPTQTMSQKSLDLRNLTTNWGLFFTGRKGRTKTSHSTLPNPTQPPHTTLNADFVRLVGP